MSTTPTELANPNIGMDNFITGLQEAGMQEAVEAVKEPEKPKAEETAIAPAEPAPKKEAAPAPAKPAEEKKEAPKETPKPVESEEDKWPRSAKDWEARKAAEKKRLDAKEAELASLRAESAAVKAEIEQLKKQGPSPELEALKKEKAELDEQLKLIGVERHPKFKAYFENKIGAQIELAKRIVGGEKAEQVAALLKAPDGPLKDRQLEEMFETMTPLQQGRLADVVNSLSNIESERLTEIQKAQANYDTIQKQNAEAQEKQRKEFETQFDATVKSYSTNPAFQKRDDDVEWNAEVDKRIETARGIVFGNQKPEFVFKSAMDAVAYPAVLRQLSETLKTVESLQAQVAELSSATPRVDGGKSAEAPTTAKAPETVPLRPGHTDPMSAIGAWMKNNTLNQD